MPDNELGSLHSVVSEWNEIGINNFNNNLRTRYKEFKKNFLPRVPL